MWTRWTQVSYWPQPGHWCLTVRNCRVLLCRHDQSYLVKHDSGKALCLVENVISMLTVKNGKHLLSNLYYDMSISVLLYYILQ